MVCSRLPRFSVGLDARIEVQFPGDAIDGPRELLLPPLQRAAHLGGDLGPRLTMHAPIHDLSFLLGQVFAAQAQHLAAGDMAAGAGVPRCGGGEAVESIRGQAAMIAAAGA